MAPWSPRSARSPACSSGRSDGARRRAVLIAGDIGIGLILTIVVLAYRRRTPATRPRHSDTVGEAAKGVLASFALAVLLVEGVFPGAWLIVAYSLYGGPLEDRLPLGASLAACCARWPSASSFRPMPVSPAISPCFCPVAGASVLQTPTGLFL